MPCVFNNHSISSEPDWRARLSSSRAANPRRPSPFDPWPPLQPIATHDKGGMLSPR
jgi:hypothetical protein